MEREEELTACLQEEVAGKYTTLKTVRMMTWNGASHSMSDAEMEGIVRYGDAFLDDYVKGLIEAERQREEQSGKPAVER